MTATAHALIGGAIAASIPNPGISLPLIAISHPIADMIPHWDFGFNWRQKPKVRLFAECLVDLGVGLLLAYLFFGRNLDFGYFLFAIALSEAWDILQAPYWLLGWKFPPFSYFYNFQHEIGQKADLPWGILTQIASVGGVVFALRFVH